MSAYKILSAAGFFLIAALPVCHAAAPPNIIVIMTDDQTVSDLAVMQSTRRLLADNGVTFTNSFTDFPLCCPSRATFLTGQAAHNHAILGNTEATDGGYQKFRQLGEAETLPVWLQRAGYTTMHFGKYMNGYGGATERAPLALKTHIPPGWNEWFGKGQYTVNKVHDYELNENGRLVRYGCSVGDYETDVARRKTLEFIAAQANVEQPFFIWVAPLAPHSSSYGECPNSIPYRGAKPAQRHDGALAGTPVKTPPNFNEADVTDKPSFIQGLRHMDASKIRDAKRSVIKRRESLLAVDELVAKIVLKLRGTGQLSNTCLIFTSDNGFMTGEHRVTVGKELPYEESIGVPLIIRCPGMPKGVTRRHLVNNTDLVATIIDLAGATPGRVLDGRSLVPIIQDAAAPWRVALLLQGTAPDRTGSDEEEPRAQPVVRYKAVRTKDAKYIEYSNGEREFYYLKNDAAELVNRSGNPAAFPRLKAELKAALDTLRDCAGASCWMEALPSP